VSTLKVDNITGRGSTGFTGSVKSEGGNTTTDLQQGLAKVWVNFDGTGTIAARDSLNLSSLTDIDTGRYQINISSVFGNNDYAPSFTCGFEQTAFGRIVCYDGAFTTSVILIRTSLTTTTEDIPVITGNTHGDLA